jgi:pimeloyl-ACP methyl ester carboxylesterase
MGFVFIRVFAWLAALPYALVLVLVVTGGTTWSAVAYVIALGIVLAGLMTLPFPEQPFRRRRGVTRLGLACLGAIALLRILTVGRDKTMQVTDGSGASARLISRLVDESDVAINASRALFVLGLLHDDAAEVSSAMRLEYARMHREHGELASPLVATHLGLQQPSGFDLVVIEPPSPPRGAVVFLHGTAGNFELPCWQVARSVASLGLATACPSTRWVADWASESGEAIVRRTVALLRARGLERFVLAGLSAGGYGASMLAPRMKGDFAGLVLLSGADPEAPASGIPALVIQGRDDTLVRASDAFAYAERSGARYVDVDAGHFALLVRSELVEREIREFIARLD